MNSYNSKLKFQEFTKNSHFLRVDNQHPLELLIGLNDFGQKTIRFIGFFERIKIKGTKIIDAYHFPYYDKMILNFSLVSNDYSDLFYLFCNDLIDSTREFTQEGGYSILINRFERWKGFGNSSKKYLSDQEIKGLIGELLFLKDHLFTKFGVSKSIQGWTGTEQTSKDFSYDDTWYEVKAASKELVTISSIEQLDSDNNGFLVVFYLEKMSPESNEISLNKLIDEILSNILIIQDQTDFIIKLVEIGYYKEDYYDDYNYRLINKDIFFVDKNFPRLKRSLLSNAIYNVRYDLITNMLTSFKRDSI